MARKSVKPLTANKPARLLNAPKIHLTLKQGLQGQIVVGVSINEFIAYSQNTGFTRLNLTGGKVLEVKETTDQIDRLVRAASSQPHPVGQDPALAFNPSFHDAVDSGAEGNQTSGDQPEFPSLVEPPKVAYDNRFVSQDL